MAALVNPVGGVGGGRFGLTALDVAAGVLLDLRIEFRRKLLLEHRRCLFLGLVLHFADSVPLLTRFFGCLESLSSFRSKLRFLLLVR